MTPNWCYDAAREVHARLGEITRLAEETALAAPDPAMVRGVFVDAVARIIEAEFRRRPVAPPTEIDWGRVDPDKAAFGGVYGQ